MKRLGKTLRNLPYFIYIYETPKLLFPFFISCYILYFPPNKWPRLCLHRLGHSLRKKSKNLFHGLYIILQISSETKNCLKDIGGFNYTKRETTSPKLPEGISKFSVKPILFVYFIFFTFHLNLFTFSRNGYLLVDWIERNFRRWWHNCSH